jgi:hypothetical protein
MYQQRGCGDFCSPQSLILQSPRGVRALQDWQEKLPELLMYRACVSPEPKRGLGRVLKLAEMLDFVGAKPPQNQVLKQTLEPA